MAFVTDKEVIKPGLIIFRRGDVSHRNFYCRVKMPREDRYKTIALGTDDLSAARGLAIDRDAEIRVLLKHDHPVFNRSFRKVADEYLSLQERRAATGEISAARVKNLKNVLHSALDNYVGSTQVHLIGPDRWNGYPTWRRENGTGRNRAQISDATIDFEMGAFNAAMNFAISKKYVPASQRFAKKPALKTMRRDEFTLEEYRLLHTRGRKWITTTYAETDTEKKFLLPTKPAARWARTMCYNFMLIMCNTGMRPPEAKNLRWRDITTAKDREGRDLVVLFVQGKGKTRKLVAPANVGKYLDRIKATSKATKPEDPVFTTITGKPIKYLYEDAVEKLLTDTELLTGPNGTPRSTYCFRHTYATLRLSEGTDVYILAEQMGTSVKMIEQHYGHVNTRSSMPTVC